MMGYLFIKNFKVLKMNRIITFLVMLLAMTSCDGKKSVLDDYYAEITDKDLREAIIEYDDSLKKKNVKNPYVINVRCYSVGDTLVEYYISKGLSGSIGWDHNPILYVSNVNGKDVVFTSGEITKDNSFVRVNKKIEDELVRRNFPDIYPKYISGQPYRCVLQTDGDNYQLFYHKGKLIYKNKRWPDVSLSDVAEMIAAGRTEIKKDVAYENMEVLRAGGHHCAACEYLSKQAEEKDKVKKRGKDFVYDVVEKMPSFPGGLEALKEYLKKNTMYPNPDACITGRVVVVFVVDEKGNVGDVKVARSVEPSFDAEAVRVVKAMPRWNPGMQNGEAVKVRYTLPVTFRLKD